ncbi:hypothetical protein OC834_003785 [Tilletia horrida]|nr:hypothetical protein OC834_003785 [Tilletia horrida]
MSFAGKKKGGFSLGGSAGSSSAHKAAPRSKPSPAAAAAAAAAIKANGKGKGRALDEEDDEDDGFDDDEEFDDGDDDFDAEDEEEEDEDEYEFDGAPDGNANGAEDDDGEPDTDEEIEAAKAASSKSSRTAKRKRRATSPGAFGATLQSLLGGGPDANNDSEALSSGDDDGMDDVGDDSDGEADAAAAAPSKKKQRTQQQQQPPFKSSASLTTATTGTLASSRPSAILSLAPHLRRTLTSQKLNAKAARLAIQQRKMREERAHVTDVIGGWGPPGVLPVVDEEAWMAQLAAKKRLQQQQQQKQVPGQLGGVGKKRNLMGGTASVDETDAEQRAWLEEGGSRAYERKLRKVAQRGVVKLFNAIRAAQTTSMDDVHAANTGSASSSSGGAEAVKKTAMPGGKEAALSNLSKNNFLDLIRSGSGKAK